MSSPRTKFSLLVSAALLMAIQAAFATPEEEWQSPFNLQMPAASRSIILDAGVDAKDWARRAGLSDYQVDNMGTEGSVVNVAMEDREWQSRQQQLCGQPGVASCEDTQCQQIQLSGRVRQGPGIQSFKPRLRLLRKAPGIEQLLNPTSSAGSQCAVDNSDFGRPIAQLTRPPQSANFELDPAQLPEDTQCWDLVIESACASTTTPLQSLVPAVVMNRVLVTLPTSNANAVKTLASRYGLRLIRQTNLKTLNETLAVFEISGNASVNTLLPSLLGDQLISEAWPEHLFTTSAMYSDPYAALAYGPAKVGAPQLHKRATGKGITVAIIDTGVDEKHPELEGRIGENLDVTGKGKSADLHGTAIAGIIAARANNGLGSYGVAPDVSLLTIKACQPLEPGKLDSSCWTSTLVEALDIAVQKNARIVNMSLGGPPDKLLARYIAAARQRGLLIVAAAGNGGSIAKPAFPAALDDVVAVTATDAIDHSWNQANAGDYIELGAPGVDIISATPSRDYPVLSGTSMASAHVSGMAALLMQLAPDAGADELRKSLDDTSLDLGAPGPDPEFGNGRIDGCHAAKKLTDDPSICGGD